MNVLAVGVGITKQDQSLDQIPGSAPCTWMISLGVGPDRCACIQAVTRFREADEADGVFRQCTETSIDDLAAPGGFQTGA